MNKWNYEIPGISDDLFIRGKVPMTKSEVRAVTVSKLKIKSGLEFLDIGAGTGSVSMECGVLGCKVTAIERNLDGIDLIKKNSELFNVKDINIITGLAPLDLDSDKRFDRVFIGGSGGKLTDIFSYLEDCLKLNGIIVANTITIENTSKILEMLKDYNYKNIEIISMNISRSRKAGPVHMMIAENPITIISAVKGDNNE